METITKDKVIKLMEALKEKGFTDAQLAVELERTTQTIWAWRSKGKYNMPCRAEFDFLNGLL